MGDGERRGVGVLSSAYPELDLTVLPQTDEEAEDRAERWRHQDPFPEIDPALLNTADLFDYIATTGMIFPFKVDASKPSEALKPASCGIRLGGEVVYWDVDDASDDGPSVKEKKTLVLGEGKKILTLPSNSIVYATLAPTFRLPDYIAARFNLNIYLIYRGLLVGTGPLVDPGFRGQLSLPLHNLTASPCAIEADKVVIWMEFTKLSRPYWKPQEQSSCTRSGVYVPFPTAKLKRGNLETFLEREYEGKPIISSIPDEIANAKRDAKAAEEAAKRTRQYAKVFELGAAFALIIGVLSVVGFIWNVDRDLSSEADATARRVNEVEEDHNKLEAEIARLRKELRSAGRSSKP